MAVGASPGTAIADATGQFLYVATSSGIYGYKIDPASGTLTLLSGPVVTGTLFLYRFQSRLYTGGNLSGFSINATTGALTAIPGSPFHASSSVISDITVSTTSGSPATTFLYAVDGSEILAYTLDPIMGTLTPLAGFPVALGGASRVASWVPPSDYGSSGFLYVGASGGVAAYSFNVVSGVLAPMTGSPFHTDLQYTNDLRVYPGDYSTSCLFVVGGPSNQVHSDRLDPSTGSPISATGSPFSTGGGPTDVLAFSLFM